MSENRNSSEQNVVLVNFNSRIINSAGTNAQHTFIQHEHFADNKFHSNKLK